MVGHGGASGYIAVLTLFAYSPKEISTTALLLNIIVAGTAFWNYSRTEKFSLKFTLPLVIGSIPFAFIGGLLSSHHVLFYLLLSISLTVSALRFLMRNSNVNESLREVNWLPRFGVGSGIGFISGVVGVGGGIFLSPLMIFCRWSTVKQTSVISAFFIVVNSISALVGRFYSDQLSATTLLIPMSFAILGGWIGSYLGSSRLSPRALQITLSVVLLVAGFKSFMKIW